VIQPTVTVTVAVPVIDGFWLEAAVTVAVPTATDVTNPVEEMVAEDVGVMLHETDGLLAVLPSLLVAKTVIWTVLFVVPVSMVGDAGPTAREDIVGLTKNPVHPTPRAKIRSAAQDPARRSLFLDDDISYYHPRAPARIGAVSHHPLRYDFSVNPVVKNCSREDSGSSRYGYFRAGAEPARLMPCFDENAGRAQACTEKGPVAASSTGPYDHIANQATVTWVPLSEEGLPFSAVRQAFAASERADLPLGRSVLGRSL
jgi:hypothetical protein